LFAAAYPPEPACDDLSARIGELAVAKAYASGVNTRLARRDTWHVTLAFLGEVADARAPGPPVTLRLAGGGRFGRGRFTVLWVGVRGDGLDRLARRVRHELRRNRISYDDRPFRPHLTIARPGDKLDGETIEADRELLASYEGPAWPVTEILLMRSHLGPRPAYERVAGYPLG
jgi:2'-5' RNA ligase